LDPVSQGHAEEAFWGRRSRAWRLRPGRQLSDRSGGARARLA
jgi:hypothetical protein